MAEHADKSFAATPHRRQQARAQGHVAFSQDLASAALLLVGVLLLMLLGRGLVEFSARLMRHQLGEVGPLVLSQDSVLTQARTILGGLAEVMLPILGLAMLGGALACLLQTGPLFVPGRLAPDPSRISIVQGFRRMFSLSSTTRLGFGLLKLVAVGAVAGSVLWTRWEELLLAAAMPMPQLAQFLVDFLLRTLLWIGLTLLILALGDYALARWRFERDLRMTPQEMREELKNQQGDPQVALRLREMQRQVGLDRVGKDVPARTVSRPGESADNSSRPARRAA